MQPVNFPRLRLLLLSSRRAALPGLTPLGCSSFAACAAFRTTARGVKKSMNRRNFLTASGAAGLAAGVASAARSSNQYIEPRYFYLRNSRSNQVGRTREFMEQHHLPMAKRNDFCVGPWRRRQTSRQIGVGETSSPAAIGHPGSFRGRPEPAETTFGQELGSATIGSMVVRLVTTRYLAAVQSHHCRDRP